MVANPRFAHISNEEIEKDIRATEYEISVLEGEIAALEATPTGSMDYRMANFRARGKQGGVNERKEFIDRLKAILKERGQI